MPENSANPNDWPNAISSSRPFHSLGHARRPHYPLETLKINFISYGKAKADAERFLFLSERANGEDAQKVGRAKGEREKDLNYDSRCLDIRMCCNLNFRLALRPGYFPFAYFVLSFLLSLYCVSFLLCSARTSARCSG